MKYFRSLSILACLAACGCTTSGPSLPSSLTTSTVSQNSPVTRAITDIYVDKGQQELYLASNHRAVRKYHIDLGIRPKGDKVQAGDGRTPEGTYPIIRRNPWSSFHKSLEISYPDPSDKALSQKYGVDPGGDIFIHGDKGHESETGTDRGRGMYRGFRLGYRRDLPPRRCRHTNSYFALIRRQVSGPLNPACPDVLVPDHPAGNRLWRLAEQIREQKNTDQIRNFVRRAGCIVVVGNPGYTVIDADLPDRAIAFMRHDNLSRAY